MIYLSDIDGTLADLTHRLPLIKGEHPDWPGFFRACTDDTPIRDVIQLLVTLNWSGNRIFYLTGRSDEVEKETRAWLWQNDCPGGELLMRKQGDHRADHIIKGEMLDQLGQRFGPASFKQMVAGVFEDRAQVVKMYRDRGFRVFQVAEGDF